MDRRLPGWQLLRKRLNKRDWDSLAPTAPQTPHVAPWTKDDPPPVSAASRAPVAAVPPSARKLVQEKCAVVVDLLAREGPNLRFPYSSDIKGSAVALRELRVQCGGHPYRILYAFDPKRNALLILGGDNTGNNRWYEENVPRAEQIYRQYLKEIEEESK